MTTQEQKWELAISHYFKCFKWKTVAEKMGLSDTQVYRWTNEKEFQEMLEKERQRIIQENNDDLRNYTEDINFELVCLAKQDDDLSVKIQAIKEFNRKFEKLDENNKLIKAQQTLEEIKASVGNSRD